METVKDVAKVTCYKCYLDIGTVSIESVPCSLQFQSNIHNCDRLTDLMCGPGVEMETAPYGVSMRC